MTAGSDYRKREAEARELLKSIRPRTRARMGEGVAAPESPSATEASAPPAGRGATTTAQPISLSEAEALARPVSYFVGRGLVEKTEVDTLVANTYRKAEAAINMVVPIVAVWLAVSVTWPRASVVVLSGIVALGIVVLLVSNGRRLHYGFKREVRDLITGRLDKAKAAENQKIVTIDEALTDAQALLTSFKKEIADLRKRETAR